MAGALGSDIALIQIVVDNCDVDNVVDPPVILTFSPKIRFGEEVVIVLTI